MRRLRWRDAGDLLTPWTWALLVAAIFGAASIVLLGAYEQEQRKIPQRVDGTANRNGGADSRATVGPERLTSTQVERLVQSLNELPHAPSGDYACGNDTGAYYQLRLTSPNSSPIRVIVSNGGCLGVDVRSDGQDWAWDRWDPSGSLRQQISNDLAAD